jgi:hypothetical protein
MRQSLALKRKVNRGPEIVAALTLMMLLAPHAAADRVSDRSWIPLSEAGTLAKWLRPHNDYCDSKCTVGTEIIEMGPFISNPNKLGKNSIFVSLVGLYVSPKMLDALSGSPNLRNAYLSNTNVDDASCAKLATCPNLYSVDLSWDNITNAGLQELAKLNHLHIIKLRGVKISQEMASTLATMPNLDYLDVSGTDAQSVANVFAAKGFAQLRTLGLQDIDFSQFSSPQKELNMPKLRTLALDQSKVNDRILNLFLGLPSFRIIRAFKMADADRKAVRAFGKEHELTIFEEQYMRGK